MARLKKPTLPRPSKASKKKFKRAWGEAANTTKNPLTTGQKAGLYGGAAAVGLKAGSLPRALAGGVAVGAGLHGYRTYKAMKAIDKVDITNSGTHKARPAFEHARSFSGKEKLR